MKILYGRKTTLFPFSPEDDMEYFLKLLQHEGETMGQCFFKSPQAYLAWVLSEINASRWVIWTAMTKGGSSKKIGFIVLYDPNPFGVTLQGLIDKSLLKGLPDLLDRGKMTFTEDAVRTVLDHAFSEMTNRVSCEIFKTNGVARRLVEKIGFVREGKLREAGAIKGKLDDIILYSLIKSDRKEQHEQPEEDKSSRITSPVPTAVLQ